MALPETTTILSTVRPPKQVNILSYGYQIERCMYVIAFVIGIYAVFHTIKRITRERRNHLVIAARLISYKISLTVADLIVLFIYAPTQAIWITTFWWYGGDYVCRGYKFVYTFAFHLTANMQVLIAVDRLYITTRLNRVSNTRKFGNMSKYHHNCFIGLAWLLAFCCALPQIFIFREDYFSDGSPQCVSFWATARRAYIDQRKQWMHEHNFVAELNMTTGTTTKVDDDMGMKIHTASGQSLQEIEETYYQILVLEQVYNIFHLASICVIPYLIEMLCYASILYLLKGAKKGQFISFKDITKMNFVWCPCFSRTKKKPVKVSKRGATTPTFMLEPMRSSELSTRCESLLIGDEPTDGGMGTQSSLLAEEELLEVQRRNRMLSLDIQVEPSAEISSGVLLSPHSAGTSHGSQKPERKAKSISIQIGSSGRTGRSDEVGLFTTNKRDRRRASAPANNKVKVEVKPWMNTVAIARRRTRKKAFYMLTLNLIFWAPYCILGIVNAMTVFEDYQKFQFVCSLLVFNAITNILL